MIGRLLRAPRLRNDLYCVEWDVKLYYTIPFWGWPLEGVGCRAPEYNCVTVSGQGHHCLLIKLKLSNVIHVYGGKTGGGGREKTGSAPGPQPRTAPALHFTSSAITSSIVTTVNSLQGRVGKN